MNSNKPSDGNPANQKTCTTCLALLSIENFYSKGKRQDSTCKACTKQKKRTTYVAKTKAYNMDELKFAVEMLFDFEIKKLGNLNQKLMEIISKCQKIELP